MYRVIGIVLVLLVVGGLYVATEGIPTGSTTPTTSTDQPYVPPSSSDAEFKNLKIN